MSDLSKYSYAGVYTLMAAGHFALFCMNCEQWPDDTYDQDPSWLFVQNDFASTALLNFLAWPTFGIAVLLLLLPVRPDAQELKLKYVPYAALTGAVLTLLCAGSMLGLGFTEFPNHAWNQPDSTYEKGIFCTVWGGLMAVSTLVAAKSAKDLGDLRAAPSK